MPGIKHLIECHCVLAIYRNSQKIINHKFPVYSKFDTNGKVIPKIAQCNNCDTFYEVTDLCKAEVKLGNDQTSLLLSKEDISMMMPSRVANYLEKSNVDISVWEHVLDVIEEKRWGETIVIKREIISEKTKVKAIEFESEEKFKIFNETISDLVTGG